MARKRAKIALNKLPPSSTNDLASMVTELRGDNKPAVSDSAKPPRWSRRFVASGKNFAPKMRLRDDSI